MKEITSKCIEIVFLECQSKKSFCTIFSYIFALYIILSRDMPLSKSDFFSQSEFLIGLLVGIFRAAEESIPQRYTRTHGFLTKSRASSNNA